MAAVTPATPLIALDAIVIDTETTGLDPARARVVQIAAVRLSVGRLAEQNAFSRLVRPGEAIPAAAARVHGIDDATVAGAASFAEVWGEFTAYVRDAVLIGHSIGFDIAVLKRECARIGLSWEPGTFLDVALLAQVAEPNLPGYSLESLAAWLGIEIVGRHSALGDAVATARIFLALIPRLRARGIRTLAEASRASNALAQALEAQQRAGWAEPPPVRQAEAPARIDVRPYRHRAGTIMSAPPRFAPPDTMIGAALETMARARISSLLVASDDGSMHAERVGIVTERDVMRALSEHGAAALAMPVDRITSRPLVAVPAQAFAYVAIGRMNRLKIRHLGVIDELGSVVGVLSARDLLKLRDQGDGELGDGIEQARDVHELGLAWSRLTGVARGLVHEGLSGRQVAAIVSHQLGEMTRRAVTLAERAMQDAGAGPAPCRFAFLVLGSAGRGESLLAMDQDNALVYEGAETQDVDGWFEALAVRVADTLHAAGVPYCKGGVMAKNPQWRGSLDQWRGRIRDWIGRSSPHDLLAVDIFFDLLGVAGDASIADALWREAFDAAKGQAGFAKLLVSTAEGRPSPLGWWGGLVLEQGRIDLKKHGLFPIVSAARALAVCHHVAERSTPARLSGVKALGLGMEADLEALDEAHALFVDLVLRQQLEDAGHGRPLGNTVEAKRLTRRERERLRTALRSVRHVDAMVRDLLFRP